MMIKTPFVRFIALVALSFAVFSPEAAIAQTYTLTDLGVLPGTGGGVGRGINNLGHVVGWCATEAFLWTPEGGMVQLPHYAARTFHAAYDINDSDVVVGTAGLEVSGPNAQRAVRWRNGTVENLGVIGTGAFSAAYGINDHGWITGYSYTTPSTSNHPFFYSDSTGMISISTFQGYGHDINNNGQITGYRSDNVHAFIWAPPNTFQDLGVPAGWAYSYTFAINNNSLVVGGVVSASGNSERFARYVPGSGWQVLGGIGEHNQLWGVNSAGVAVGAQGSPSVAYRWTEADGLRLLDSLIENRGLWHMLGAFDINESGQITGYAINNQNGTTRPVLLTPVVQDVAPPAIESLTIQFVDGSVRLTWFASAGAELYRVHGSSAAEFTPSADNLLMSTASTFAVLPASDPVFYYNVIAVSTGP